MSQISAAPAAEFGEWLIAARRRCGVSQKELSARSGVSQSMISNMERGGRAPSRATAATLAAAVSADPSEALVMAGFAAGTASAPSDPGYLRLLNAGWRHLSRQDQDEVCDFVALKASSAAVAGVAFTTRSRHPSRATDADRVYDIAAYSGSTSGSQSSSPAASADKLSSARSSAKRRKDAARLADTPDTPPE
jgi:transcriptional regulator with XRE-family HTH domain